MNQEKIGKFIAEMRKNQNFSQKQLADKIGVSDKTISKWETGVRLPDASLLLELCQVLQIDVNELLAGEKLQTNEHTKTAETNIVNLVEELNEMSDSNEGKKSGTIFGILFTCLGFLSLILSSLGISGLSSLFDLPIMLYLTGLEFLIIAISGWFHDFRNAFILAFHKDQITEEKRITAMYAIKFAGLLALATGSLISIIGAISAIRHIENLHSIGPALAQMVLSFLYTSILEIIYLVIYFRLKK